MLNAVTRACLMTTETGPVRGSSGPGLTWKRATPAAALVCTLEACHIIH